MMMMMYEEKEIVQNAWSSELPADLLGLISDKVRSLSLSEYIKFGSVCIAWRSFSIENYQHIKLPSKLPMLLIPIPTTTTTTIANNIYIPSSLSSSIEQEASEIEEEEEEALASSIEEEVAESLAEAAKTSSEASSIEEEVAKAEEALAEASLIEEEAAEESLIEEEALAEASLIEEEAAEESEDDEMEDEIKLPAAYYNPKDIWKGQNYQQRYRSTRNFYSISEKKVYHDFGFHVPYYKNIRGSSNGWLVTVEECCSDQGVDYYPVRLFNPFRADNNEIQLPPLVHWSVEDPIFTSYYLRKATLSANPSSLSNPTTELVVLGLCSHSLAFCRPGDKAWTHLKGVDNFRLITDIICYRGEFYAILHTGYVFAFDTALFHPTITVLEGILPPDQEDSYYPRKGQIYRYLVESEGELLQVRRDISASFPPIQTCSYVTRQFLVFKLDPMYHTKWVETKTFNDRMLFLGNSFTSMSLSALEFPMCKPNSIYYTDDMEYFYFVEPCSGPHDIGVFSMEDGSFEKHHGLESMIMPAPVWIQPML